MKGVRAVAAEELEGSLRRFYDYWNALPKRAGRLPVLADFFDHVPPELAPYIVIADVTGPAEARIRLFGTRLVHRAEFDPTGLPVAAVYAEALRGAIHDVMWTTVQRPVGYLLYRKIVVRSGFLNEHRSVGLPVEIPTSGLRAVINYTIGIEEAHMVDRGEDTLVQEMALQGWIDVGAGVPG